MLFPEVFWHNLYRRMPDNHSQEKENETILVTLNSPGIALESPGMLSKSKGFGIVLWIGVGGYAGHHAGRIRFFFIHLNPLRLPRVLE